MLIDKNEMFTTIKGLVKERNELLEKHPELVLVQCKFDEVMRKAGSNKTNRCVMAQIVLMEHFEKLRSALNDLKLDLDKLAEGCNNGSKLSVCQDDNSERHSGKSRI